jgi:purine-cytosine permease-like protein
MNAADIGPVSPAGQTQSSFDLFLIFVGANVVATTFQVGASLVQTFTLSNAMTLIVAGSIAGAALVAALAPLGPQLRVPSVIAARAAMGARGAALVAVVLYASNFAWIALNNVIAASACARIAGGAGSQTAWAVGLGLLATGVVALGPRAVARADRVAVPLLLIVGAALTIACLRLPPATLSAADAAIVKTGGVRWLAGLDIVIGYQVSWILMFADYSRYTRSVRGSTIAVFVGLAATSIWMMPLGAVAARAAGTSDPGAMLDAVGLGAAGALLLTLATLTTNFVNIYMSSLAWKSLVPRSSDQAAIWSIGLIGTALSAIPGVWLEQYTRFMTVLGAVLVPVGGVLVAHFYGGARGRRARQPDDAAIAELYDPKGRLSGVSAAGVVAWIAGTIAYFVSGRIGGTVPALLVSMTTYAVLSRMPSVGAQPLQRIE